MMTGRDRLGTFLALACIIVGSSALFALIRPGAFPRAFGIALAVQVMAAMLGFGSYIFWRRVAAIRMPDRLYAWALDEFQRNLAWGPFRPRFLLLVIVGGAALWWVAVTLLRALGVVTLPN